MNAPNVDPNVPHPARVYDYWLGGKDNYAADRAVAEAVMAATPGVVSGARETRAFLGRAVRWLCEQGVDQFLDLGSGLPASGSTHEVAQGLNPAARVAYVDNDPVVLVHARELLREAPEGRTTYIEADLRRPRTILDSPEVRATLDFSRPIAVIIVGTLAHLRDEDDPWAAVRACTDATVPGSYLALTHLTSDGEQVLRFFDGFQVVEPGLVRAADWKHLGALPTGSAGGAYGVVGRKI